MLYIPQRFARWPTAAQLLQFDRLWRFITQAVKNMNHPRLSQPLSVFICDEKALSVRSW